MRSTIDVFLYPGDDEAFRVVVAHYGTTIDLGDGVTLNWMGADATRRAVAALRPLLAKLAELDDEVEP